ncbi:hypothetical protein [Proteiniclasticum ruminis]|uniref:Uncharacterized protein n=1 Tax=Proteiniclasticum ruminis TaxID=398199 RepID=A0A1I5BPY2_9CLOT|nr:hypothetical protein [Proteiniclasticum ruminis]SFN76729.1 hypothetical protein SAMN04488695_1056 [Proteiniclasticum ruminis]
MQAIFETLFDVIYLTTVFVLGVLIIRGAKGRSQYALFGWMAVVLAVGDSFHLIPRAIALNTVGLENYTVPLGVGKFITSITMTVFYILLYYVWRSRYAVTGRKNLTATMYLLAAARILLSVFPQNGWTSASPSLVWGILRNIPFSLMGILVIILFYRSAKTSEDASFRFMWLTIVLSFAFYIPVVLWADLHPLIGMLMIPKTCAYVWTVFIGYGDMRKSDKMTRKKSA